MPDTWRLAFRARWVDIDFNQHMRNAAFLGCAEETRSTYMDEHGFPISELQRLQIGPVVLEDRLVYKQELRLLERFHVDIAVAAGTADMRRMKVHNTFTKDADGSVCAVVESVVLWFDLEARKPIVPPQHLQKLWADMPRTADFEHWPDKKS